jgi:hypothetical protein
VDDKFVAAVRAEDAEYFSTLNEQYWLSKVVDYCNQLDIFDDPTGKTEIVCFDDAKSLDDQQFYCIETPIVFDANGVLVEFNLPASSGHVIPSVCTPITGISGSDFLDMLKARLK